MWVCAYVVVQVAEMREALLKYEQVVAGIKAQLINEHAHSRAAFAQYERTIGSLEAQLAIASQQSQPFQ